MIRRVDRYCPDVYVHIRLPPLDAVAATVGRILNRLINPPDRSIAPGVFSRAYGPAETVKLTETTRYRPRADHGRTASEVNRRVTVQDSSDGTHYRNIAVTVSTAAETDSVYSSSGTSTTR